MSLPKALSLAFILSAFLAFSKSVKIVGEGVTKTQSHVYLYEAFGDELFKIDSAEIKKGSFTFKIDDSTPKGVYGVGYSMKALVPIVLPLEEVVLGEEDGVLKLKKGVESFAIKKYFEHLSAYDVGLKGVEKRYGEIVSLQQTDPDKFNAEFAKIRAILDSLNVDRVKFFKDMSTSSEGEFSKEVGAFFAFEEGQDRFTYLDTTDFTNDAFTRGAILDKKINMYFMNFVNLNKQNLRKEFEVLLGLAPEGTRGRQVMYATIIKIAAAFDPVYAKGLYKTMRQEYPKSEYVIRCKKLLPPSPPAIGDEAAEIILPNVEGEIMKLSDLKGKVVLIDFWASWCGPCRREMPNVVAAYNQYRDKGFTVYSISLDGDKARWQNAIKQDGMVWPYHVSELKKWDSKAARDYFVRGIPATFLVDERGVIVGTNLRGASLHKKLAELLTDK